MDKDGPVKCPVHVCVSPSLLPLPPFPPPYPPHVVVRAVVSGALQAVDALTVVWQLGRDQVQGTAWGREGGREGDRQAGLSVASCRRRGGREGGREGRRSTWLVVLLIVDTEVLPARLAEAGLGANGEHGEFGVHAIHAAYGTEGVAPKALFVLEGGDDGAAL